MCGGGGVQFAFKHAPIVKMISKLDFVNGAKLTSGL